MGILVLTLGGLPEKVCFKCKAALEDDSQPILSAVNLQAVYTSRRRHCYCHDCYKRWLPENER